MPGAHLIVFKTYCLPAQIKCCLGSKSYRFPSQKYQGLFVSAKIHCQIFVSFFQDGHFNWSLKRKLHFFPFFPLICTLLNM